MLRQVGQVRGDGRPLANYPEPSFFRLFLGDTRGENGALGHDGRGEEIIGRPIQAGRLQRGCLRRPDGHALPHSSDSSQIGGQRQSTWGRSGSDCEQGRLFGKRIREVFEVTGSITVQAYFLPAFFAAQKAFNLADNFALVARLTVFFLAFAAGLTESAADLARRRFAHLIL